MTGGLKMNAQEKIGCELRALAEMSIAALLETY